MKILISPHGTHGDLRPLIALGIELEKRDHDVTFSGNLADTPFIEKHGYKNIAANFNLEDDIKKFHKIKKVKKRMEILFNSLDHHAESLFEVAKDFDLIIGSGYQLLGPTIAEFYDIPYFHIIHSSNVIPSDFHPPTEAPFTNFPKFINRILWSNKRRIYRKYVLPYINSFREKRKLPHITNVDDIFVKGKILSVNKALSQIPHDVKFHIPHTDYWHLYEKEVLDEDLITFVKSGVSPVYIGFGAMPVKIGNSLKNVVKDLLKSTQLRFILSSSLAGLDFDDNNRVYVIGDVPHSKLFPELSLVVHHGGAGTTNTALLSGIPQIIIPQMGDQYYFAKRVYELEIGSKPVNINKIDKELPRRIVEILSDSKYRENAQNLANSASQRCGVREAATFIEKAIGKVMVFN